ncbi:hypothetical protein PCYB_103010 [Plasmodium cynomolgi strain B]|uniref:Uncharacterized protein n=1 Tax=Plasmodium cynomolgi (strain B) TaxID=1120755 RepID=K6UDP3_PLACD|nr:hypothetical protein PCYB_103010 [Plasmodium cynomolgi strain B]GAB66951.1 hypothetical protein PCYB_103010 [Plasmodium cynomolgi strain B]
MGRYNTKRTEMKKVVSFFFPLCVITLLAYLNDVKLAGCKDTTEQEEQNKKGLYSFVSLKFIPFIVHSLIHTGVNQIPREVEEKHIYNFEKSPAVRYMLIAQERRDNFMYICFLVVSFVVVILIAIFIFKFFFNL